MTPVCPRENELLDAMGRGFIGAELEAHVSGCESCRDLRLVAGALLDDRRVAVKEAAVPSSGTMWWRMQVRQRQDAMAAARRSLLVGQAASVLLAIVLTAMFFGEHLVSEMRQVLAAIRISTPLLAAIGTWLLAVPIAGYIALRQK